MSTILASEKFASKNSISKKSVTEILSKINYLKNYLRQ